MSPKVHRRGVEPHKKRLIGLDGVFEHVLNGFVFSGNEAAAAALQKNPNVVSVTRNGTMRLAETQPEGTLRIEADDTSGFLRRLAGLTKHLLVRAGTGPARTTVTWLACATAQREGTMAGRNLGLARRAFIR